MTPSRVLDFLGRVYLAVVCPAVMAWHRFWHTRKYREYQEMMDRWL